MKLKKWLKQKQFRVKFEFKLQDFFIGFYWKTQKNIYGFKHLDLWILIIPTLPIHIHCIIGRDRTVKDIVARYGTEWVSNNAVFLNEHFFQERIPYKKRGINSVNLERDPIQVVAELSYDSAGRAYPPMPESKNSWGKTYKYKGKYYKITGDEHHKEWSEITIT